jgi:hypothetical protein
MSCIDVIEVVPTETTTLSGSASELRYRLLMAALLEPPTQDASSSDSGVVEVVPAKPAAAPTKPKRSRR